MTASKIVPLFVLPMGIFPLTQEPLRVFEPRYKQMLDDCVLEDAPFGYVATVNPPEGVGGCLLYTSPSPRDLSTSRMPSSA